MPPERSNRLGYGGRIGTFVGMDNLGRVQHRQTVFGAGPHALVAAHVHATAYGRMATMNGAAQVASGIVLLQGSATYIGPLRANHDDFVAPERFDQERWNPGLIVDFGPVKGNAVRHAANAAIKAWVGHGREYTPFARMVGGLFCSPVKCSNMPRATC